ncbi:MAG: NUDIX domain-containing protein [Psychrobium sp.]|nr:NUDIX domain-containing protein [Psychrobium sp.]
MSLSTFTAQDVEIVSKETLWQGYFKMVKFTFRHRLFSGGKSELIERELFDRGHAVAVIPYDPVTDEVVLIEQIRVGAFDGQFNPWLIELVAGIIEPNEHAMAVARRETLEETGLVVEQCEKIMSYLSSPGGMSESMDLFLARIDASQAAAVAGLADEGEDIRVITMPVSAVFEALRAGEFVNATTIIGLQWLQLNHQRVRQQWLASSQS